MCVAGWSGSTTDLCPGRQNPRAATAVILLTQPRRECGGTGNAALKNDGPNSREKRQNWTKNCCARMAFRPVLLFFQLSCLVRHFPVLQFSAATLTHTCSLCDVCAKRQHQWRRNREFRRFNEPRPPSSWGPRVVGHRNISGKTLRKIIKIVATR